MRYLTKYKNYFFLIIIIFGVVIFSSVTLTTRPPLFQDESLTIELSRNLLNYGRLNIVTSVGVFYEAPFLFQSTGYTMTIPLAIFFKFFGFGFFQARLLSLALIVLSLLIVFWYTKKLFGVIAAYLGVILSLTSLEYNYWAHYVTGEATGIIFLLIGLDKLFNKKNFFYGGWLIGLAVISKPSVYMHAMLAVLVVLAIYKKNFWYKFLNFCLGLIPPFFLGAILSVPGPWVLENWIKIINLFKNPFGLSSPVQSILLNLLWWPYSPILSFSFFLFSLIAITFFLNKKFFIRQKSFFIFFLTYGLLAVLYYIKSPGWLRYLFGARILLFIAAGSILGWLSSRLALINLDNIKYLSGARLFSWKRLTYSIVIFFIFIFPFQKIVYKEIPFSDESLKIVKQLNQEHVNDSIYFINAMEINFLVLTEKRFQFNNDHLIGWPPLGRDWASSNPTYLPKLVVVRQLGELTENQDKVLKKNYQLVSKGKYNIYRKESN